jgi:hypothetical protein
MGRRRWRLENTILPISVQWWRRNVMLQ